MAGQRDVMRRYERYAKKVTEQQTEKAVTLFLIQTQMHSATMIPVMTSNLINSEFRRVMPTSTGFSGEVGYGANYALHVHEAKGVYLGKNIERPAPEGRNFGNYWDPDGQPGYLRKGAEEAIKDWPNIVREAYR